MNEELEVLLSGKVDCSKTVDQINNDLKGIAKKLHKLELNLGLSNVIQEFDEITETTSADMKVFNLGNSTKIRFYPVFSESKIYEMLNELQDILQQMNSLDVVFDDNQLNHHILFLCIKHFTDKKDEFSSQFDEQLVQLNYLIDAGYYEHIINKVFSQSEINKVFRRTAEMFNVLSKESAI